MQRKGKHLTHEQIRALCGDLDERISQAMIERSVGIVPTPIPIYGIPRGGVPVAYMLEALSDRFRVCDDPNLASVYVDDILDSGATKQRWMSAHPGKLFFAMIDKSIPKHAVEYDGWVHFPWEESDKTGIEDHITRLLEYIGENPNRGGLLETPKRVAKAWKEWTSGYSKNPEDFLKVFEDGADAYDQIVMMKNIPFYSHCEHHMAPFFGLAHIGYIPDGRIVGLSKIVEVVHTFSKRLQVQERLTNQIAEALWSGLNPKGVGVVTSARHLCIESRGKNCVGQSTPMSAFRGIMLTDAGCKAEFLSLTR